jgi:hypothetical protein
MSIAHRNELRSALTTRGWKVIAERQRGDDDDVPGAATWEIQRGDAGPTVEIDFAGFGAMGEDIPLEQSYACTLRGRQDIGLYFWRINRSRERWLRDLWAFVDALA